MTSNDKERRLEAARAKLNRLREVSKTRNGGAQRMDWKPKAKIYLHPETELHDRLRIWFPKEVEIKRDEEDKGGTRKKSAGKSAKSKVINLPFNVSSNPKECPFQTLRQILKDREEIDGDDVILSVGSGRQRVEMCKGEILGWEGYDFRKSLRPQSDFVCAAIMIADKNGKRPDELKCEVLSGAKSLGTEIRKEIESEIDESGEEAGNPFFTPYPFIIEYDENERGSDMYSARARVQESPKGDEKLEKLLEADPPSLEEEIELSDVDVMLATLNDALVYDGIEVEIDSATFKRPKESEDKDEVQKDRSEGEERSENAQSKKRDVLREDEVDEVKSEESKESRESNELKESKSSKSKKVKESKIVKEENPPKKLGWCPKDGEDYDICPMCREPVPVDAMKCPHTEFNGCTAEYQDSEEDPF